MGLLKASPFFYQNALAALERCALFLFRYLESETAEALTHVLHRMHRELKVPFPHHPLLDCRGWPDDAATGEALNGLLRRLGKLEREE